MGNSSTWRSWSLASAPAGGPPEEDAGRGRRTRMLPAAAIWGVRLAVWNAMLSSIAAAPKQTRAYTRGVTNYLVRLERCRMHRCDSEGKLHSCFPRPWRQTPLC